MMPIYVSLSYQAQTSYSFLNFIYHHIFQPTYTLHSPILNYSSSLKQMKQFLTFILFISFCPLQHLSLIFSAMNKSEMNFQSFFYLPKSFLKLFLYKFQQHIAPTKFRKCYMMFSFILHAQQQAQSTIVAMRSSNRSVNKSIHKQIILFNF